MDKIEAITIYQTLHGYKKGHRLIEKSNNLPLSPETERTLLQLSDLSGPYMIEGFDGDGYITAYPIYDYDSHYYLNIARMCSKTIPEL